MIISMTGYGRGENRQKNMAVALEVKSINHRHLEAVVKLPGGLWELENTIKEKISQVIRRGRVEVYLHMLTPVAGTHEPVVDTALASKYLQALRQAGQTLKLKGEPDLVQITKLPNVVRVEERPIKTSTIRPMVEAALKQALQRLLAMRRAEGKKLAADIKKRLANLKQLTGQIKKRYAGHIKEEEKRLQKKLSQLLKVDGGEVKRLAQEACLKHIRSDITEELVRLNAHFYQFGKFMSSQEPVGRRLDFLLQEMNREINTVGAKASDTQMAHQVVMVKEELEKIREQVQNFE